MATRAVLLANLGSPDTPDVPGVRRYLNQFLMDPDVIQLPWILRRMIVSLFVLPLRPKTSAHAYQSVWTDQGSPLIVLSANLLAALKSRSELPLAMAMRYGNPSIEQEILELARENPDLEEILYLPLYPHHADSTVVTSVREAERVIRQHALNIKLNCIAPFYDRPDYIAALTESARPWLETPENFDHILFSYHGLPESHIKKADPTGSHCLQQENCCHTPSEAHKFCYRHQVIRTTELFVAATGLPADKYTLTFQSRLGRAKWLEPSTENTIRELAEAGCKRLLVICPAFVTDCLETLEEIEIQGNEVFQEAGGETLTLIPCMNDHPVWVETLAHWFNAEA